jgi:hypothetical protein
MYAVGLHPRLVGPAASDLLGGRRSVDVFGSVLSFWAGHRLNFIGRLAASRLGSWRASLIRGVFFDGFWFFLVPFSFDFRSLS